MAAIFELKILKIVLLLAAISLAVPLFLGICSQRYKGPGRDPDNRIIRKYGAPSRRFFTSTAFLSLRHRITILDERHAVRYRAEAQIPTIHGRINAYDAEDAFIGSIERRLISLHSVRIIRMADGTALKVSRRLINVVRDILQITGGVEWTMHGNILHLNYTVLDPDGALIAIISRKLLSLHRRYEIDLYRPEYEKEAVSVMIALYHIAFYRHLKETESADYPEENR